MKKGTLDLLQKATSINQCIDLTLCKWALPPKYVWKSQKKLSLFRVIHFVCVFAWEREEERGEGCLGVYMNPFQLHFYIIITTNKTFYVHTNKQWGWSIHQHFWWYFLSTKLKSCVGQCPQLLCANNPTSTRAFQPCLVPNNHSFHTQCSSVECDFFHAFSRHNLVQFHFSVINFFDE